MFSMAMWMAVIVAPAQIVFGDLHGINTLEHQPAKVMAMEGHYESHPEGAPLYLFGIPNAEEQRLDHAVGIPGLSSLILKHDPDAPLAGLDTVPDDEQPPVAIVFWAFRIMVAIGFLMLGLGLWSLWARWKGRLFASPWLHRAAVAMGALGPRRRPRWLDHHRGRAPALHGLRPAAHERERGPARRLGGGGRPCSPSWSSISSSSVLAPAISSGSWGAGRRRARMSARRRRPTQCAARA